MLHVFEFKFIPSLVDLWSCSFYSASTCTYSLFGCRKNKKALN